MTRASMLLRVLAPTAALVVATACIDDRSRDSASPDREAESSTIAGTWGPLAVVEAAGGGDDALIAGTLKIDGDCVLLEEDGEAVLLLWPSARTSWDPDTGTVRFDRVDGERAELSAGDPVTFAGGGTSIREGGAPAAEFVASIAWVAKPSIECVTGTRWFIADLVDTDQGGGVSGQGTTSPT